MSVVEEMAMVMRIGMRPWKPKLLKHPSMCGVKWRNGLKRKRWQKRLRGMY